MGFYKIKEYGDSKNEYETSLFLLKDNRVMKTFLFFLFSVCYSLSYGQRPKDGTYTYSIVFAEWAGKSNGATCTVIIKGNSIRIINNGNVSGKKDGIIDQGIIMKHMKTGKWIIGHSAKDKNAKEVGGCSDGPSVIDFKRKEFWLC